MERPRWSHACYEVGSIGHRTGAKKTLPTYKTLGGMSTFGSASQTQLPLTPDILGTSARVRLEVLG